MQKRKQDTKNKMTTIKGTNLSSIHVHKYGRRSEGPKQNSLLMLNKIISYLRLQTAIQLFLQIGLDKKIILQKS